jgi:hypothetical protein
MLYRIFSNSFDEKKSKKWLVAIPIHFFNKKRNKENNFREIISIGK